MFRSVDRVNILPFAVLWVCSSLATPHPDRIDLDFFFSPGCSECARVEQTVLPKLDARFKDRYVLVRHDLTQTETIPLLIAYQDRCHNIDNGRVSIVVDHTVYLSGYDVIATGLCDRVQEALARHQHPGWKPEPPPDMDRKETRSAVTEHARGLTLSVVVIGGLLDGFNPCAISTLILFMSVLIIAQADRKTRLFVGLSFIGAAFVVYTGLGLGVLYIFRKAPHFAYVKRLVEIGLGLGMFPLALLSFRDAARFHKSRRPTDVTLQLPKRIKARIHSVLTTRLTVGASLLGGAAAGAIVTLLESVCTGQSYVPVLMYLLKSDVTDISAWGFLLLYNAFFVLPLVVVFGCFHCGLQLRTLIEWSKRNLVAIKLLLGLFFAAMAVLLLWP